MASTADRSDSTPNFNGQLRYILEWFGEFSPLQKSDFLPILAEHFAAERRLNGLPPIRQDEAPSETPVPSIFQCRIKLLLQWTCTWTHRQKWELINRLRGLDPDFVNDFLAECTIEPPPGEEAV